MSSTYKFTADKDYRRVDVFLSEKLEGHTRSSIKKLIEKQLVKKNGTTAKPSDSIAEGDTVCVSVPDADPTDIVPQDIPIDIIYQDEDIAVINKKQGMVVHPAAGNPDGTLVNAIMYHIKDLSGINGELRPGIVHRLDKDTSGLIVIAKNDAAHTSLAEQIKNKTARRIYRALVWDNIKEDSVTVDASIGRHRTDRKKMAVTDSGRSAQTVFTVLERFGDYTYVECELKTGRTHQIRVHAKHIGHPVVGDPVYSSRKAPFSLNGQLLHAYKLILTHPVTGEEMEFTSPLPDYFSDVLDTLRKRQSI